MSPNFKKSLNALVERQDLIREPLEDMPNPNPKSETGEFEYFFELYARIEELKIAFESANECVELIRDARTTLDNAINEAPQTWNIEHPTFWGLKPQQRERAYTPILREILATFETCRPQPTPREVLEIMRIKKPQGLTFHDNSFTYLDATGADVEVDMDALGQAIRRHVEIFP